MLSDHPVLDEWKRRAQEYERIIAAFEKMGNDMRRRRIGALDSVMELLDDRIELNERTMKSMRLGLKTAQDEIRRLEAKAE